MAKETTIKATKLGFIDTLFIGILVVIFGGIVLHAPVSVGLGTLFPPGELLIKSWKEILMVVASVVGVVLLTRRKQWGMVRNPLLFFIGAYALLHILLIPLSGGNSTSTVAGLLIDLRYPLCFVLVYVGVRLFPQIRKLFVGTFIVGALVVGIFAILQVFVLPPDILSVIGYGDNTIAPYLTIDNNMEYIRISSTLRGPNPLGAYAATVLILLMAFWLRGDHSKVRRPMFIVTLLLVGSAVALWASYSRSGLIVAFVGIAVVFFVAFGRRLSRAVIAGVIVGVLALGGGLVLARDTPFVSNVLLHESLTTGFDIDSNGGHLSSVRDGIDQTVHQPLGAGIGSTGSASLHGSSPFIIENQYLFIAHETGWIGLALFIAIFWKVLRALWQRRADWLTLGVFASGVGLALIGLLQPVWVDDTVSIIWWGLAALVIGGSYERGTVHKASKRAA